MSKNTNFAHFWANLGRNRIFPKNPVRPFLSLYSSLTSCNKSEKSNERFSRKQWKCLFLGQFANFWPDFSQTRNFPKNPVTSLLSLYSPLTSCKKSEKSNEPNLRKSKKCPFLHHFGPIWAKYDFFQKSKHLKPHSMIGNDLIFHFKSLPGSLHHS